VSTRTEMLKTALISFLPYCVAVPLTAEMQKKSFKGKALTFQELCSRAYRASKELMTETAIPLQFGRNIGQDSAAKFVQFNSIQAVNGPVLKPKQTVVTTTTGCTTQDFPCTRPPATQIFPLPHWRPEVRWDQRMAQTIPYTEPRCLPANS
jgi:hypothetical protein